MNKNITILEWDADTFYMFHDELIQYLQLNFGYTSKVFSVNKVKKYTDVLNLNASFGIFNWMSALVRKDDFKLVFMVKAILLYQVLSLFVCRNKSKTLFVIEGTGKLYSTNSLTIRVLRKFFEVRLKLASVIIVLNQSDYDYFAMFCGNVHLLNGIGLPSKYFQGANLLNEREFRYGFVGRKIREKGIHEFASLTKYSDKKHIMIGENDGQDSDVNCTIDFWKRCSGNVDVDFVTELLPYYDRIEFLVFPSTYNEGYPRVLMEAMSRGVIPIIIYKQKFDADFVHKSNCLKYRSFDVESIIKDVNELCEDANRKIQLMADCEEFSLKYFSLQSIANDLQKLIG